MTTILIIYAVGVLINAFAAASIYDDLAFFVLASFATWLYMIGYLLVKLIKSLFKQKSDGNQKEKAS